MRIYEIHLFLGFVSLIIFLLPIIIFYATNIVVSSLVYDITLKVFFVIAIISVLFFAISYIKGDEEPRMLLCFPLCEEKQKKITDY